MLYGTFPLDVMAQTSPATTSPPAAGQPFNANSSTRSSASVALYPTTC